MKQVTISWMGDHGTVAPSNVQTEPEEEVRWTATGSEVEVIMTKPEVFGTNKLTVPEGQTVSLEVQAEAPPGEYEFPVHCKKDPGDATPPVVVIVG